MVYFVDNSLGGSNATVVFEGVTGNTNAHCVQSWLRGFGTVSLRLFGGSPTVSASLTSDWSQYQTASGTPASSSDVAAIIVPAGASVYIIMPGLYEAPVAPYAPIPGATLAAVTRAIESFRLPMALQSVVSAGSYSGAVRAAMRTGVPVASVVFSAGAGNESNRCQFFVSTAGRANLLGAVGGVTTVNAVSAGTAIVANEAFGIAAAIAAADYAVDDSKGAIATSTAAGALPPVSFVYLGRRQDGAAFGNGFYSLIGVWPGRLSNARIQSLAVPYV